MQADILMQTLTVRETLEFAAKLKLKLTDAEIK
jgi:ABC-type multidrug transport system ATPase subunit